MAVVVQYDYVELTQKEIQEALKAYVKTKYAREVRGEVSVDVSYGRDQQRTGVQARADLQPQAPSES